MAIAYWNIVLKDRFKFLDLWCKFLQVSFVRCSLVVSEYRNYTTELHSYDSIQVYFA